MDLKKNVYLISGPAVFKMLNGKISVIGKYLKKNEEIKIPLGKTIPFEVEADSSADISVEAETQIKTVGERTIPAEWDGIVSKIIKEKISVVLVLGEVDTGKTFFSTYISNKLLGAGASVSVLDMDAGQSDIGPPGTLGLAVLREPQVFLSEVEPAAVYYMGSHSPSLHFLPSMVGCHKLVNKGLSMSDVIIIDTPGWVQGDGGRALRRAEIEMLRPGAVVLLQRKNELEHLVKTYPTGKIVRILVSKKASFTSADERKKLRELISQGYFAKNSEIEIPFEQVAMDRAYLLTGEPVDLSVFAGAKISVTVLHAEKLSGWEGGLVVCSSQPGDGDMAEIKKAMNTQKVKVIIEGSEETVEVALCDGESNVLSLAIIKKIDYAGKRFVMWSPIPPHLTREIKIIQFGSLRMMPDGRENGFTEPGYF
ncbi:MAG: Clp1/GlmU family protein [Elusimicrobiota bacterium]